MSCCGPTNNTKIDLKKEKFPEFNIKINEDEFIFKPDLGKFFFNEKKHEETEKEIKLKKQIDKLKKQYEYGEGLKNNLDFKIQEIEEKIELMEKILCINYNEIEYLLEKNKQLDDLNLKEF